jgi:hypothetical protein
MTELEHGYVAENIMARYAEPKQKPRGGRKESIERGRLLNSRDSLIALLGSTWPDVGRLLPRVKTQAELSVVLEFWKSRGDLRVIERLTQESSRPADVNWLNEKRRKLPELNKAITPAWDNREKFRRLLETAQQLKNDPTLSDGEKALVDDQVIRYTKKFADAEEEYQAATKRQVEMEKLIAEGEANFARTEFLRFLKSKRYRLNPVNIANALAGLPYIGWRQSAKRCKKCPSPAADGFKIGIFGTIRRIVLSNTRKSDLVKHAESWLRLQNPKRSYAVAELQENWFYLQIAINGALTAHVRTPDLPFVITKQYYERKLNPQKLDRTFAPEESISNKLEEHQ